MDNGATVNLLPKSSLKNALIYKGLTCYVMDVVGYLNGYERLILTSSLLSPSVSIGVATSDSSCTILTYESSLETGIGSIS